MSPVEHTTPSSAASPASSRRPQAGVDPYSIPLDEINVADPELFRTDTHWGFFERLRKEAPVHYCKQSGAGPYRSVTRFDDIVYVEKNPEILDGLPVGETFDWVDRVSIELTTRMLATMFDFPFEDRRKLPYWSDILTATPAQLADWGRTHAATGSAPPLVDRASSAGAYGPRSANCQRF
ncbi:MAG: hypothetical protein QF570_16290, partial [Myxococcota bacterium]|nr:hypothetical protein [Myxococcota bacterium]